MKRSLAHVLRPVWDYPCDCTNGGISGRLSYVNLFSDCTDEEALLYCEEHNMNPDDQLIFKKRHLFGGKDHSIIVPLVRPEGMVGPMFGGNYAVPVGSDPNFPLYEGFHMAVPLPIHDRFETTKEAEILSR